MLGVVELAQAVAEYDLLAIEAQRSRTSLRASSRAASGARVGGARGILERPLPWRRGRRCATRSRCAPGRAPSPKPAAGSCMRARRCAQGVALAAQVDQRSENGIVDVAASSSIMIRSPEGRTAALPADSTARRVSHTGPPVRLLGRKDHQRRGGVGDELAPGIDEPAPRPAPSGGRGGAPCPCRRGAASRR